MTTADAAPGGGAWHPTRPRSEAAVAAPSMDFHAFDDELAAIIRRAAAAGIPGWRIATALGIPLPSARD